MNYGLYLSAASMRVNAQRVDVMANNLANVRTNAFKQDFTVIQSRPAAPAAAGLPAELAFPLLDRMAGGLTLGGTHTDFRQGTLEQTDRQLDLALDGNGFFVVQADGQRSYTRDGRFTRVGEGNLVTVAGGHPVLDADGQPVQLPGDGPVSVDSSGFIRIGETAAKLAIVQPEDMGIVVKVGGGLYRPGAGATERPATGQVRQGFLEGSGTEAFTTLVDLIAAQRAYDASARLIRVSDTMLGRAVNDIAQTA